MRCRTRWIGGRLAIVNVNTFEGARLHAARLSESPVKLLSEWSRRRPMNIPGGLILALEASYVRHGLPPEEKDIRARGGDGDGGNGGFGEGEKTPND